MYELGPLWLVDGGAVPGTFGPTWAGLMPTLGLGGAVAGRLRTDRIRRVLGVGALLVGSAAPRVLSSRSWS